jgi:hypothetical protein
VADVTRELENYERHRKPRERRRKPQDQAVFEEMVSAIVCDLAHAHLSGVEGGIAITRSNRELAKRSRYRSRVLGKTLPRVLDYLSTPELEFVEQVGGYLNPFSRNQRTLIRPGRRLQTRIEQRGLGLSDLGRSTSEETIILKASKEDFWDEGEWIEYEDTEATIALRSRLDRINAWLDQADLDLLDDHQGTSNALDPGDRRLRRFFTRGSFESGGRLFGGFWQGMKKNDRLTDIRIEGEEVIELDYGQMTPRMLYGLVGAQPGTEDAYLIPGSFNPALFREGFKKLLNALLFAQELLRRKPQGTKGLLPNAPVEKLIQALQEHHSPIAHFFGTGIGHQLQFRESQLMVEVLLRLQGFGVIALPVHDAVIIPTSAEEVTRKVMGEVFLEEVGLGAMIRGTSSPNPLS